MKKTSANNLSPELLSRVLTDVHFWVPFTVLVAGLLLLKFIL